MDWMKCIKTFHCVVERKSFSEAAHDLHTTPSVISKRIAWLENLLQAQLLRRTTRQQTVTEAGSILYARSKPFLNIWDEITNEISSSTGEPRGIIRLGMPVGFGAGTLIEILAEFLAKYPQIHIEQKWTHGQANPLDEQIDIFITHYQNPYRSDAITVEVLGSDCRKVYASPKYVERYGTPKSPDDLKNHNCIINSKLYQGNLWQLNDKLINVAGNYTCIDLATLRAAALSGIGVIYVGTKSMKREVRDGALVELLPDFSSPTFDAYVCYPNTPYLPTSHRVFLDFLFTRGMDILMYE